MALVNLMDISSQENTLESDLNQKNSLYNDKSNYILCEKNSKNAVLNSEYTNEDNLNQKT